MTDEVRMFDAAHQAWMPLGTLLVHARVITSEQLEMALMEQQQQPGRRLGEILVEWGWASNREIAHALSEQYGLALINLARSMIDVRAATMIDGGLARRYQSMPVRFLPDGGVLLAVVDPTDLGRIEELRETIGKPVRVAVVEAAALETALEHVFGADRAVTSA
jgi:hypothetical protein